jgi:hypothetical protein
MSNDSVHPLQEQDPIAADQKEAGGHHHSSDQPPEGFDVSTWSRDFYDPDTGLRRTESRFTKEGYRRVCCEEKECGVEITGVSHFTRSLQHTVGRRPTIRLCHTCVVRGRSESDDHHNSHRYDLDRELLLSPERAIHPCSYCNRLISPADVLYCSRSCRRAAYSRQHRVTLARVQNCFGDNTFGHATTVTVCAFCRTSFTRSNPRQRFCSNRCRQRSYRQKRGPNVGRG